MSALDELAGWSDAEMAYLRHILSRASHPARGSPVVVTPPAATGHPPPVDSLEDEG